MSATRIARYSRPVWLFVTLFPAVAMGAQELCRIDTPVVSVGSRGLEAVVTFACSESDTAGGVRYDPDRTYFLGMSAYEAADHRGQQVATTDDALASADFEPRELSAIRDGTRVTFTGPFNEAFTHYLVVLWDFRTECGPYASRSGCEQFGVVLGRLDMDAMPFPVDAFPRPRCDVEKLTEAGFFAWTEERGDPSGYTADERLQPLFEDNDCWRQDATPNGLGYSVRRWRLAPLPGG